MDFHDGARDVDILVRDKAKAVERLVKMAGFWNRLTKARSNLSCPEMAVL